MTKQQHREYMRNYMREYRKDPYNKKIERARAVRYYYEHLQQARLYHREYNKTRKEYFKAWYQKKKERELNNNGNNSNDLRSERNG